MKLIQTSKEFVNGKPVQVGFYETKNGIIVRKLKRSRLSTKPRVSEMDRIQVIHELARYAHPTQYHSLLKWNTDSLKKLLSYYRATK